MRGILEQRRERFGLFPHSVERLKQDERVINFTLNGIDFFPSLFSTSESFRLFVKNYSVEGDKTAIGSGNCCAFFNKAATIANANGRFNWEHIIWTNFSIHRIWNIKITPIVERISKRPKNRVFALLYCKREWSLFIRWEKSGEGSNIPHDWIRTMRQWFRRQTRLVDLGLECNRGF